MYLPTNSFIAVASKSAFAAPAQEYGLSFIFRSHLEPPLPPPLAGFPWFVAAGFRSRSRIVIVPALGRRHLRNGGTFGARRQSIRHYGGGLDDTFRQRPLRRRRCIRFE